MINTKKFYQDKFKKYGLSHKSLMWKEKGAAHQRFRQFWAEIDFNDKNVLDVGCGFGEMGNFLTKRYKNVKYKGVDIVPEFIYNGKLKYPGLNLEVEDFFGQPKPEVFDTVICSGAINSNLGSKQENMEFRKNAIKTMFDHATHILAFNMLGTHPQIDTEEGSNVWYADSLEVLEYCMSLTRRVIFRHHYNSKDFTIIMYKDKNI